MDIGELEFENQSNLFAPIVSLATGRSHVIALDSKGRVWTWGTNDKGQLGHKADNMQVKSKPEQIKKLKNIVQIYSGEYQSFAVDNVGEIFGWGLNKNNCLLVNQPEIGLIKTIV